MQCSPPSVTPSTCTSSNLSLRNLAHKTPVLKVTIAVVDLRSGGNWLISILKSEEQTSDGAPLFQFCSMRLIFFSSAGTKEYASSALTKERSWVIKAAQ